MSGSGFLREPESTAEAQRLFDEDIDELGYVMNASRLWAHQPDTLNALFDLMRAATAAHVLDVRQRGILVAACASALGDSYCSLSWGSKLAKVSDAATASGVLRGDDRGLTSREAAVAAWARKVVQNPSCTTGADVEALREAGFGDGEIFASTVFVALRIAFSTVNDALGARPDAALRSTAPEAVLDAVRYGRPIEDQATGT